MPNYRGMVATTDSAGVNWSYLGSERAFRALKDMEERNLIVPLTGNFAGDKALRAVGTWARDHGAKVTTFYVSNVEQYLFQQGDEAPRFYNNVATLPIDGTSLFVRSFAGNRFMGGDVAQKFHQQSAGRSMEVLSTIDETVKAFKDGKLTSWADIINISHQ